MKNKGRVLLNDIKEKDEQLVRLQQDYETHKSSISKNDHSRSFFTRQILEIVTNTNKQKEEINKTIIETRVLQKDLNRLTEKLERTFQVTDSQLYKVIIIKLVLVLVVVLLHRMRKQTTVLDVHIKC
jgi:septal ring factor EnvC (AmiA/AmiB activator)